MGKDLTLSKHDFTSPDRIDAEEEDYLYVAKSNIPNAGNGLFTAMDIYPNERISVFKGELLNENEASKRAGQKLDAYFMNTPNGGVMDAMQVECFAKYANDDEANGNKVVRTNAIITMDENEEICLVALKKIKAGSEIFCAYGAKYWQNFRTKLS